MNSTRCVPYRMWDRISNFGDAINPHVLTRASGLPPVKVRSGKHVLAIGSVMHKANANSHIWGTGVMHPHMAVPIESERQIYALRGRLTRDQLHQRGIIKKDVPLGDPGFLVGRFWPAEAGEGVRGRIGIVPHHGSADMPAFQRLAERSDHQCMLIDMRTLSMDVLRQIWQCDVIISQSLHGLIFAEAYGKPSLWISSQNTDNWFFKFRDWYSTTSNQQREPVLFDVNAPVDFVDLARRAELRGCTIDPDSLMAACPARQAAIGVKQDLLDFVACRDRGYAFMPSPLLGGGAGRVEDAARDELRKQVLATVRQGFSNWAESQYAVVGDDSYFDDPARIARALRYMNRRSKLQCMFLERLDRATPSSRLRHDSNADVDVMEGPAVSATTVLIRPSGEFTFDVEGAGTMFL